MLYTLTNTHGKLIHCLFSEMKDFISYAISTISCSNLVTFTWCCVEIFKFLSRYRVKLAPSTRSSCCEQGLADERNLLRDSVRCRVQERQALVV